AAGLGASIRACFADDFAVALQSLWLADALSILAVAPPLLGVVTPWLSHLGLAPAMTAEGSAEIPQLPAWGGALECAGLAIGAGLLGVLVTAQHAALGPSWHLWAMLLLLVVWASLRQGLRGGALTATAAAVLALLAGAVQRIEPGQWLTLQGNLFALCST